MARPRKKGLDYFSHDVNAANDPKIEAMRALYGNDGYAFYFILLEQVYQTGDGKIDLSTDLNRTVIAKKVDVTVDKFLEMLDSAFELKLFDKKTFLKQKKLTSNGIGQRISKVNTERAKKRQRNSSDNGEVMDDKTPEKPRQNSGETKGETPEKPRKEKKTNINNKPPIALLGAVAVLSDLKVDDDATLAHKQAMDLLEQNGYVCQKEYYVPNRGDGQRGRIDIVAARGDETVAIEFDHLTPREKSIFKLRQMQNAIKIILLRGGNGSFDIPGITVIPVALKHKTGISETVLLWESIIGRALSSYECERIPDLLDTYSPEWVDEAMRIAADNSKLKLSYVEGVLERWQTEGKDKPREKRKSGTPDKFPDLEDVMRRQEEEMEKEKTAREAANDAV